MRRVLLFMLLFPGLARPAAEGIGSNRNVLAVVSNLAVDRTLVLGQVENVESGSYILPNGRLYYAPKVTLSVLATLLGSADDREVVYGNNTFFYRDDIGWLTRVGESSSWILPGDVILAVLQDVELRTEELRPTIFRKIKFVRFLETADIGDNSVLSRQVGAVLDKAALHEADKETSYSDLLSYVKPKREVTRFTIGDVKAALPPR